MHRTRNKLLSWIDTTYSPSTVMKLSATTLIAAAASSTTGRGTFALAFSPPLPPFAASAAFKLSLSSSSSPAPLRRVHRRRVHRDGCGGGAFAALGMVSAYGQTSTGGRVNVNDEYGQRDVYAMEEWASQYGVQRADGVQ